LNRGGAKESCVRLNGIPENRNVREKRDSMENMSLRVFACRSLLLLTTALLAAAPLSEIPAGTRIELRLKTKVTSNASKANDPIEAAVISPVILEDHIAIARGTLVQGVVKQVQGIDGSHPRAAVVLEFNELLNKDGTKTPIKAQLVEVDNARESADESGQIIGILPSDTLSSRMDNALQKLSNRFSGIASILQGAKNSIVKQAEPEIEYGPGVELSLKLINPITGSGEAESSSIEPIRPEVELTELVKRQPFQTVAQKPPKPSDLTNLMFLGSQRENDANNTA
jgi:hypothetical protein